MSQFTATEDAVFESEELAVDRAVQAFRTGKPVMIHDGTDREGETDLVYPAGSVEPADVARLRNDAGGLVCVALSDEAARAFDLPFLHDAIDHPLTENHDLAYDDRSSFSLTVNHRETRTGITDRDRALTIAALARAVAEPEAMDFAATFRSPGHVHLLRAAPELLRERQGHTEYGIALAIAAGRPPAAVVCEMLDDDTGRALSTDAARSYARRHDVPFVEGRWLRRRLS